MSDDNKENDNIIQWPHSKETPPKQEAMDFLVQRVGEELNGVLQELFAADMAVSVEEVVGALEMMKAEVIMSYNYHIENAP